MKEEHEHAVKRGTKSRAQGGIFETRVRKDLEEKGWTVDKWTNNVEFGDCEGCGLSYKECVKAKKNPGTIKCCPDCTHRLQLTKAKNKWSGPGRPMMMGAGFPDFIAFRQTPMIFKRAIPSIKFEARNIIPDDILDTKPSYKIEEFNLYEIIGVESKMTGELDKLEKEKCKWLLDNKIFSKILIAEKTKVKNKVVIVYHDFKEKYWRFYENSKIKEEWDDSNIKTFKILKGARFTTNEEQ